MCIIGNYWEKTWATVPHSVSFILSVFQGIQIVSAEKLFSLQNQAKLLKE